MIIGLTGGIGSGKSSVAKLLAQRGAAIIDTDAIAREVVAPPSPVLQSIASEFGPGAIAADGTLDRAAVSKIVFGDETKRRRLNEITHPEILKRVLAQIGEYPPSATVVVVVPLLFESGFEKNCDKVVAVIAPAEQRIRRVMARDGSTESEVRARMRAQLPEAEYERRADFVIHNDGEEQVLYQEADTVWSALTASRA